MLTNNVFCVAISFCCRCCQIEITRAYDHNSFFDDLRKMYFNAGANNQDIVFLFTDTQIVQEEFLEDINNMLNSGDYRNEYVIEKYFCGF